MMENPKNQDRNLNTREQQRKNKKPVHRKLIRWMIVLAIPFLALVFMKGDLHNQDDYRLVVNYIPGYQVRLYNSRGELTKETVKANTIIEGATLITLNKLSYYKLKSGYLLPKKYAQLAVRQGSVTTNMETDFVNKTNFNGVILTATDGEISSVESIGYANPDEKLQNTPDTLFPTASLQKVMTAAITMQLINEKKITFATKLSQYFPKIEGASSVTVRELLDHQSGIVMDEKTPKAVLKTEADVWQFYQKELTVKADKDYAYANVNYVLLAGIISKVTNKSYADNLKSRIINPLKLTHTFEYNQIPKKLRVAVGYSKVDNGSKIEMVKVSEALMSSLLGAGNLYMDAGDIFTFQRGLNNGQILTEKAYQELAKVEKTNEYTGGMYHLDNGKRLVEGGFDDFPDSFATIVYLNEKATTGVIMLANCSTDVNMQDLADDIYGLLD